MKFLKRFLPFNKTKKTIAIQNSYDQRVMQMQSECKNLFPIIKEIMSPMEDEFGAEVQTFIDYNIYVGLAKIVVVFPKSKIQNIAGLDLDGIAHETENAISHLKGESMNIKKVICKIMSDYDKQRLSQEEDSTLSESDQRVTLYDMDNDDIQNDITNSITKFAWEYNHGYLRIVIFIEVFPPIDGHWENGKYVFGDIGHGGK